MKDNEDWVLSLKNDGKTIKSIIKVVQMTFHAFMQFIQFYKLDQ